MSSLGIDSAIRIGNPSATIKWGLTGLQFSSPNHPMNSNKPIGQNVRIGHVHLKVADLERALGFYCGYYARWRVRSRGKRGSLPA